MMNGSKMILKRFSFAVVLLVTLVSTARCIPTTTKLPDSTSTEPVQGASQLTTTPDSKESGESTSTRRSDLNEQDIYIIFFKDNGSSSDSNEDSNSTKKMSKRDTKLSHPKDDGDDNVAVLNLNGDDSSSSSNETDARNPSNSTSKKNSSQNSTVDIILLYEPKPRPILIDVIFFRFNSTKDNQTGPYSPSLLGGQGVGHSNPIKSDEDAESTSSRKSVEDVEISTKKSHAHSHNRRRRDTIFSHLTNNSQTTTSLDPTEDGKLSDADNSTEAKVTTPTPQESNNATSTDSNQPDMEGSEKNLARTKINGTITSTTTSNTATSTENPIFFIFKEIVEYGGNVTKAIFGIGKVEEDNNADSNSQNGSESSGADDNDDSSLSIATTSPVSVKKRLPSSSISNQNSTRHSHNQPPQTSFQ